MNKGQVIDKMAADAGISKAQAGAALNSFLDSVKSCLVDGDKLTLIGFGTFSVSERAARIGHNPKTGKKIQIAAKKSAKFKAGKALSEALNA